LSTDLWKATAAVFKYNNDCQGQLGVCSSPLCPPQHRSNGQLLNESVSEAPHPCSCQERSRIVAIKLRKNSKPDNSQNTTSSTNNRKVSTGPDPGIGLHTSLCSSHSLVTVHVPASLLAIFSLLHNAQSGSSALQLCSITSEAFHSSQRQHVLFPRRVLYPWACS
jgi:hypothetical protein